MLRATSSSIIALLIALLLPALDRARSPANIARCANHQRQIILARLVYAGDNDDRLPGVPDYPAASLRMFSFDGNDDFAQVYHGRYIQDRHLMYCPEAALPDPDAPLGDCHPESTVFHYFNCSRWYVLIGDDIHANVRPHPSHPDIPRTLTDPGHRVLTTADTV